ncbi:tail fiber protein [Terasakiella sp. A23]|uniref:phage tail protein n=1 Tax=Terasakiella sp. FCG-A23 TaxID=3080561 RepID=UPI002953BEC5|nr:tail fiber protein [Terasakiella sp. A23]MDV7340350.1 tail fiber protein [Terasakiella sp. A23]
MKSSLKLFMGGLAVASGLTLFNSTEAHATCDAQPYMSTICWTMAYYCPKGYAEANGQILAINNFQALYSLLGTSFGGDGRTTFGLPDLRGRAAIGTGQGPGLSMIRRGQQVGKEEHMLTEANMPAHSHTMSAGSITIEGTVTGVTDTGDTASPVDAFAAARPGSGFPAKRKPYYNEGPGNTTLASDAVALVASPSAIATDPALAPSGQQQALPLRAPQVGVLACIATEGIYPPRS